MSAVIDIYNLAIGNLGVQQTIASTTEKSNEARACNRFYAHARDLVLRSFPWPFATKYETLALVQSDPNTDWKYAYRYPSACLFFRRIINPLGRKDVGGAVDEFMYPPIGVGYGVDPYKIPYTLSHDSAGKLIYSDQEKAVCEFTEAVTDTTLFDPLFVDALGWKLAAMIGPGLTSGDPFKMVLRSEQMYMMSLGHARAASLNETREDQPPEAESIRARR